MKKIFENTWRILGKAEKRNFSILVLLDILVSIADIVALAALLWIIQFYISPGMSRGQEFLPTVVANKESVWLIAIFFVLFGLKNLAAFYLEKAHYRFNSQVAIRISGNKLMIYLHSNYEEFVNIDSSRHIRTICLQPFEFCQYILSGIQQVITQASLVSIAVLAILIFNVKLFFLLLIILLPPVIVVFYFIKKRMAAARKGIQVHNQLSYQYVLDALKGYIESNIYNRHQFFAQRFLRVRKSFSASLFNTMLLQSMPARIIEVFAILGLFILVVIAKWSGNSDNSFLLTIGAFMAAAYKIIPGIVKITNVTGQMKAYEFTATDLARNNEQSAAADTRSAQVSIQSVELKNVNFAYANLPVLQQFNMSLQRKDFAGIVGASGKGKTTILNIMLGFLSPDDGNVVINDVALQKDSLKVYWPSIAYVRQQSFFIHDTLLRNITLEENNYNESNLEYAISISGLDGFIGQHDNGLDTIISENAKNISGGQQQRIAIARALYKNADMILLDEPFNELDEASETLLLAHFSELARQGKIVVLITHNKASLGWCNKIISLDEQ